MNVNPLNLRNSVEKWLYHYIFMVVLLFHKNVNTIRVYFPLMFGISVTVHSVHSNVAKIPDCLRQWNFGLYVSGFWHIHAKTPRGTVVCEQ